MYFTQQRENIRMFFQTEISVISEVSDSTMSGDFDIS